MAEETSASNSRIAKNTMLLYVRMLITMAISLYTSRVVLATLGVEDFGIYNVVGGVVTMFSALSGSFSTSISRFLTFEIGRGNVDKLSRVFSSGMNIQIGISAIFLIVAESFGLWFVNTQMNIPVDRIGAANWVFQCSCLTFILGLLSVPYNAAIIAHEKMSAFAYISILEVSLKLLIVLLLPFSPFDILKTYCVAVLSMALLIRFIYARYSKKHFQECNYKFQLDTATIKEMTGFAGWNVLGNGAFVLNTQGLNVLMNIFFDLTANAARGIATQVDAAIKQFVNNFTTAVNPMITKSYARGDFDYMHQLMCASSKMSAFLVTFLAVPIVVETDTILSIWLGTVPPYTVVFVRLIILSSFVDSVLANSLVTAMFATGKIRHYQIVVTVVGGLVFPLSWLAFYLGFDAYYCYVVYIVIYTILLFVRLHLLEGMVKLKPSLYVKKVLVKWGCVAAISSLAACITYNLMEAGWTRLAIVIIVNTIVSAISIYFVGLTPKEKVFILEKMRATATKLNLRK